MVKSKPNNRAKGARRARRGPRKNIQKQNQNASMGRKGGIQGEKDVRAGGPMGRVPNAQFPVTSTGMNFGGRWIERDELVAVISGSSTFATTKFPINPGLPVTFPGLSKDAQLYTEWRLGSSRFYVKPLVSGYSTQGQTGETILSFDPNALNPAPASQQQAEFLRHAQAAPYLEFGLDLPVAEINRSDSKYIRTAAVPASADLKTYDGGNLYISTYGQGGTNTCCELRHRSRFWVTAPTLVNPSVSVGALASAGGTVAAATPFGAAPVSAGAFSMNVTSAAPTVINFSGLVIGDELVVSGYATGTVITASALGSPVGLTANQGSNANCITSAATSCSFWESYIVTASTASVTLSLSATTITATRVTAADTGSFSIAIE